MVAVSIHAVSPLLSTGVGVACANAGVARTLVATNPIPTNALPLTPDDSKRIGVDLLRANTNGLFQLAHEDLAVADLAGTRGGADGLDGVLELLVGNGDFQFQLGQKIDDVFGPAVELGMAMLPAKALDLGDRHPGDADLGQCLANVIEGEWFDDRCDPLHPASSQGNLCRSAAGCVPRRAMPLVCFTSVTWISSPLCLAQFWGKLTAWVGACGAMRHIDPAGLNQYHFSPDSKGLPKPPCSASAA